MSLLDSVSMAELELRNTGVYSPEIDDYKDIALNSWDMGYLDYNAPGAEGWLNRLKGVGGLLTGRGVIGSGAANYERMLESKDPGEDVGVGDILGVAGKTLWDVGITGFLMGGMTTLERGAAIGLTATYQVFDAVNDIQEGRGIDDRLMEPEYWAKMFDLSAMENVGTGDMLLLNAGVLTAITNINMSREQVGQTLGLLPYTDSIKWLNGDFDPLNPDDIALFDQEGQLNKVAGTLNFIAEVVLDPLNFMSFGTLSLVKAPLTASYKFSYGFSTKTGAKTANFLRDENNLVKIMNGQMDEVTDPELLRYVKTFAKSSGDEAFDASNFEYLLRAFGAQGRDATNLGWILSRTKNEQGVAAVLLATNFSNKKARVLLKKAFDGDPDVMLKFDDMFNGGTAATQGLKNPDALAKTPFLDEAADGVQEYSKYSKQYVADKSPMIDEIKNVYESLLPKTDDGIVNINQVVTPLFNRTFRSTGIYAQGLGIKNLYSKARIKFARFRASIVTNTSDTLGIALFDNVLGKTIIKYYRKGAVSSLKGAINLNESGKPLTDKMYSFLNEADEVLEGSFRQVDKETGKSAFDVFLDRFQRASTTQEYKEIFDDVHKYVIRELAERNNMLNKLFEPQMVRVNGELVEETTNAWDDFIAPFYNNIRNNQDYATNTILKGGSIETPGARIIETAEDMRLVSENANWYQTINLSDLKKYFDEFLKTSMPGVSKGAQASDFVGEFIRQFNTYWSAGVLIRPARFFRERIANGLGIVLAGAAIPLWFNGEIPRAIANTFKNVIKAGKGRVTKNRAKRELYDVVDGENVKIKGNLANNVRGIGKTVESLNDGIDELEAVASNVETRLINESHRQLDIEDKQNYQYEAEMNKVETQYHASVDNFSVEELDDTRMLPLSSTKAEAEQIAINNFGRTPEAINTFEKSIPEKIDYYSGVEKELTERIKTLQEAKNLLPEDRRVITNAEQTLNNVKEELAELKKARRALINRKVFSEKTGKAVQLQGQRIISGETAFDFIRKQVGKTETLVVRKRYSRGEYQVANEDDFKNMSLQELDKYDFKILPKPKQQRVQMDEYVNNLTFDEKLSIAASERTPLSIVNRLAKDSSPEVKIAVAQNKNTQPTVLKALSQDADINVRKAAASNTSNGGSLKELAQDDNLEVVLNAVNNPRANDEVFSLAIQSREPKVIEAVLKNPNASDDVIGEVFSASTNVSEKLTSLSYIKGPYANVKNNSEIQKFLANQPSSIKEALAAKRASNPNATKEFLSSLADSTESDTVLKAIASNDVTSPKTLAKVANKSDELAKLVANNPSAPDYVKAKHGSNNVKAEIAKTTTSSRALKVLANMNDSKINDSIAENKYASQEVLEKILYSTDSSETYFRVLSNPAFSKPNIIKFYKNWEANGRKLPQNMKGSMWMAGLDIEEAILSNPNTPRNIVDTLYKGLTSQGITRADVIMLSRKDIPSSEKDDIMIEMLDELMEIGGDLNVYLDNIFSADELKAFSKVLDNIAPKYIKDLDDPELIDDFAEKVSRFNYDKLRLPEADEELILDTLNKLPADEAIDAVKIMLTSPNSATKLPKSLIKELVDNNETNLFSDILENAEPDIDIIEDIFKIVNFEEEPFLGIAFAVSENTPPHILEAVFRKNNEWHTPLEDGTLPINSVIKNQLANNYQKLMYDNLAQNNNTPENIIRKIFASDISQAKNIAKNTNTPSDILDELADYNDAKIVTSVLRNPNVSPETVSKLVMNVKSDDPNGYLLASHPYLNIEAGEDAMLAIFGFKGNAELTNSILKVWDEAKAAKLVDEPVTPAADVDEFVFETVNLKRDSVRKNGKDIAKPLTKSEYDKQLKEIDDEIASATNQSKAVGMLSKQFLDVEGDIGSIDNIERKLNSQLNSTRKRIEKAKSERKEFNESFAETIVDQLDEGEVIWARAKGSQGPYSIITNERFLKLNSRGVRRLEIKFGKPDANPSAQRVSFGGETLELNSFDALPEELKSILNVKSPAAFRKMVENEEFRNNIKAIEYFNENNIGKVVIKVGKKKITFTTSKFVTTPRKDVAREIAVDKVAKEVDDITVDRKTLNETNMTYKNREELIARDDEVKGYVKTYSEAAKLADNYEERLRLLADLRAKIDAIKDFRNKLQDRYSAATNLLAELKASRETILKGTREIKSDNGVVYTVDNIIEGESGEITEKILQANSVLGDSINSIDGELYRSVDGINQYDIAVLNPNSADYYRDYAGYIKFFLKNDGAAMRVTKKLDELKETIKLSDGEITEDILEEVHRDLVKWLRSTPEGKQYAIDAKIGRRYSTLNAPDEGEGAYATMEEFAVRMTDFIGYELYDDDVLKLVARGEEISEQTLRAALNGKPLQKVKGRKPITTNDLSNRGIKATINKGIAALNRVLVERPQTYMENIPLAQRYYIREMKAMLNANEKALGRKLTTAEVNSIAAEARKNSVKEVRKWLYNVQDKWKVTDAINLYIPFITAITFTSKMLFRAAKQEPEKFLWTIGAGTKVMGEFAYADSDGNPISQRDAFMNPNASLIIPMPEPVRNFFATLPIIGPAFVQGEQFRISTRSLNVWFGQEYVPGPGPLVAVPVNWFANMAPKAVYDVNDVFEQSVGIDWLEWALPFGIQDDYLSMVLPTWFNQTLDWATAGERYQSAFAKIMAFEAGRYSLDPENYEEPSEEDVRQQVNALFAFDLISSTTLPAATRLETEADYYRKIHRQLIDEYGKQEADWIMLSKYPEFIGVTVSTTENPYAVNPNVETFYKLEDMPEVSDIFEYSGEGAKDMLGWAVNPTGVGRYDDFFWDYLTSEKPSPGAEPYRRILSPEEIRIKASAAAGWATYNKFHDALDAYAIERNINWEDDEKAKLYRAELIKQLTNLYPSWASEYKSTNFNRFEERAFALDLLLNDSKWLQSARFDTKEFKDFVETRKLLKNDLSNRGLTLASSPAHKKFYDEKINSLKKNNIAFSVFYNRFFLDERI